MFFGVQSAKRFLTSVFFFLFGCSLFTADPMIEAQANRLRRLLASTQVGYIEWAKDSRSFALSEDDPVVHAPYDLSDYWILYNLDTDGLTESAVYPFLPQITPSEESLFVRPHGTFSYLSSDDRYLVYAGEEKYEGVETRYWTLMVGDRQSQSTLTLPYPLFQPYMKTESFDVRWNQDSKSLILVICSNQIYCIPSYLVHIQGLESGLSGLVFDHTSISNPVLEGVEYQTLELIDFSADGAWALLTVGEDYGRGASHLMMYNVVIPQSSFLITDPLGIVPQSFRFATPDGAQILYIDNQGIYRYDWANHTSTLLTTEVNNSKAKLGEFSPDGRWFVFVNSSRELYLYDLQGLPEAPTPTPTATPRKGINPPPVIDPDCPSGIGEWLLVDGRLVFVCE